MNNNDLKKALCKKRGMKTSLFFEDFEEMPIKQKKEIISVCNMCEIKDKCRKDGESHNDAYGVWGGVFFKRGRPMRSLS